MRDAKQPAVQMGADLKAVRALYCPQTGLLSQIIRPIAPPRERQAIAPNPGIERGQLCTDLRFCTYEGGL